MTVADGDRQPSGELQRLIAKYIAIYFAFAFTSFQRGRIFLLMAGRFTA